jgi:2-iminobutanoate/2-iminopropanoate deaminase
MSYYHNHKEKTMKVVQTGNAPAAIGPYSQAMISGNFLFTSGQIPLSPESGQIVGSTITEQTEQVMKNIGGLLEAAGSSFAKVVKATCFLADMGDFAAFNEVYAKYFIGKPARSTVAVKQLPKSVLVEVETIAELGGE